MNFNFFMKAIISPLIILFLSACGAEFIDDEVVTGRIILPDGVTTTAPVFVVAFKSDDMDEIEKDPAGNIAAIAEADMYSGRYYIDLKGTGLKTGDPVTLIAFAAGGYKGSIPRPEEEDIAGIFIDRRRFSATYRIGSFDTSPDITLNRKFYDHEAALKFRLEKGDLSDSEFSDGQDILLFAAHEEAIDFVNREIDEHKIIAMKKVKLEVDWNAADDGTLSVYYTLPIMPLIHRDVTVWREHGEIRIGEEDIYVFALLDEDESGEPDLDDKIAYFGETIIHTDIPDWLEDYLELEEDEEYFIPRALPDPIEDRTMKIEEMDGVDSPEDATVKFYDIEAELIQIILNNQ